MKCQLKKKVNIKLKLPQLSKNLLEIFLIWSKLKRRKYGGNLILWIDKILLFFSGIQFCRLDILVKSARMSGIASEVSFYKIIDIERFMVNPCLNFLES